MFTSLSFQILWSGKIIIKYVYVGFYDAKEMNFMPICLWNHNSKFHYNKNSIGTVMIVFNLMAFLQLDIHSYLD